MLSQFKAFQASKRFYTLCKRLKVPKHLSDQLLRASSSIALNVAEGSGKRTPQDQRRFYSIAFGSLRECEAILEIEDIKDPELEKVRDQLGAMLFTLSRGELKRRQTGLKPKP